MKRRYLHVTVDTLTLRPITTDDLAAVERLLADLGPDDHERRARSLLAATDGTAATWWERRDDPRLVGPGDRLVYAFVVEVETQVVGLMFFALESDCMCDHHTVIDSAARGRGYAGKLLILTQYLLREVFDLERFDAGVKHGSVPARKLARTWDVSVEGGHAGRDGHVHEVSKQRAGPPAQPDGMVITHRWEDVEDAPPDPAPGLLDGLG